MQVVSGFWGLKTERESGEFLCDFWRTRRKSHKKTTQVLCCLVVCDKIYLGSD